MTDSLSQATLTDRAILAGSEVLAGRRRGLRSFLPFAGPAVIPSVAYMDPGNFATNIIDRMEGNEEIFSRVMTDKEFRFAAHEHLAREIFRRVHESS
jgi:hypothetical protein